MDDLIIDEQLIKDIRDYLKQKTGIYYFKNIRTMPNNIQVTCPFHKGGQENKPSATIRTTNNERASIGLFSCFTCKEAMPLYKVMEQLLGDTYNEDEVESKFGLKLISQRAAYIKPKEEPLIKLPDTSNYISSQNLKFYEGYHPYLEHRRISKDVAKIYNIGFDKVNNQIVFPIYNKLHKCIGLGRRSVMQKRYEYPYGFIKPLYGVYELNDFIAYLYVCEGVFNTWSLRGWGKQSVALLGTGTQLQYEQLLTIDCIGYVLALDPDEAGILGTKKLIEFLVEHNRINIYVALIPIGKDINDLTEEEFRQVQVITYKEWLNIYGS